MRDLPDWERFMAFGGDDWDRLFERHGPALVLYARQWLAVRADAEDVVQETFVRYWRSRERVADPAAFLFACVRNCALDWQRERARRTRRDEAVARREEEPLFTAQIEQAERQLNIETALRGLPAEQRDVLVMKIWGGLSFAQIADVLAISANTAGSRYRYALAKLREQLAEKSIL